MARELGYPGGQVDAATGLVIAAQYAGDLDDATQLARQGAQIPDIPRWFARMCGYLLAGVLAQAGDLAAAGEACAATLAQARDVGDLDVLGAVLPVMADLDLRVGRTADAAAHLREAAQIALQTGIWFTILNVLEGCGHLSAATGSPADAVTAWAASDALGQQGGLPLHDWDARRREDALGEAGRVLGPDRARAAEQRGAARACQIFCVSWGSRCPFVMLVGSFSVPGQTGTRSPNATANAFMAAFQP